MDRAEQIGLGSAVGGHALLLLVLWLGLFAMPPVTLGADGGGGGIEATIVGESDYSAVDGDAADEPAPAEKLVEPEPEPTPVPQAEEDPVVDPLEKVDIAVTKKPQKTIVPTPQPKPQTKTGGAGGTDKGGGSRFNNDMDRVVGGLGGNDSGCKKTKKGCVNGGGNDTGGGGGSGSGKTAEQIVKQARATIFAQISIAGCMPPPDPGRDKVNTKMNVKLTRSGGVISIAKVSQSGAGASPQKLRLIEECITKSIRRASPFSGLDPDDYENWQSINVPFQER